MVSSLNYPPGPCKLIPSARYSDDQYKGIALSQLGQRSHTKAVKYRFSRPLLMPGPFSRSCSSDALLQVTTGFQSIVFLPWLSCLIQYTKKDWKLFQK